MSLPRMTDYTVYYHPACSKSRAILDLLQARGQHVRLIDYQQTPPTATELADLAARFGRELLRSGDAAYAALGLERAELNSADIVAALQQHPSLLQRPIVVCGDRAVIARPPERVLELL